MEAAQEIDICNSSMVSLGINGVLSYRVFTRLGLPNLYNAVAQFLRVLHFQSYSSLRPSLFRFRMRALPFLGLLRNIKCEHEGV